MTLLGRLMEPEQRLVLVLFDVTATRITSRKQVLRSRQTSFGCLRNPRQGLPDVPIHAAAIGEHQPNLVLSLPKPKPR